MTGSAGAVTRAWLSPSVLLALVLSGCGDTTGPASGEALEGDNRLVFVDGGALDPVRDLIHALADSSVRLVRTELPVTGVRITLSADAEAAIGEIGLGGRSPNSQAVLLAVDMAMAGIADSLRRYLPLLLAHELHHAMRHRSTAGYGTTLFEAVVSEGLADRFAVEVTGADPPPWSVALSDPAAAVWLANAQAVWNADAYDHDAWFFGEGAAIPRWTGYTLGWRLVMDYQSRHPGQRAAGLWQAPASDFLPETRATVR
jgi:hypothetical protein